MAVALVGVLALTVAPLPPVLFDLLLGTALCLAALTFLVAFYVERPTDFSSFPALLLFVTLFRLSLNVASTRLILTHGGQGEHAAGAVQLGWPPVLRWPKVDFSRPFTFGGLAGALSPKAAAGCASWPSAG